MSLPKVKVEVSATGTGYITVDGIRIPGVRAVTVNSRVNQVASVTVEIISADIELVVAPPPPGPTAAEILESMRTGKPPSKFEKEHES